MKTIGYRALKTLMVVFLYMLYCPELSISQPIDQVDHSHWQSRLIGKPNAVLTVYSKPGLTWKDCKRNKKLCLGWPLVKSSTHVQVLKTKWIQSKRLKRKLKYYRVNVAYIPKGKSSYKTIYHSWIQARFVRQPKTKHSKIRPLANKTKIKKKTTRKPLLKELDSLTQEILPHVGQCLPKRKTRRPFKRILRKHWNKKKTKTVQFSQQELFAVDALARTLYGEMRGCLNKGLSYPRAVAKVALNRAHLVKKKGAKRTRPFIAKNLSQAKQMSLIEILPYVLGSHKQFSTWNHWDNNVRKALCPARTSLEKEAWEKSVKVAVEAIFFQQQFNQRTSKIKGYHFTSGMPAPWRGFKRVKAHVDGESLNSRSCFQLWSQVSTHSGNQKQL